MTMEIDGRRVWEQATGDGDRSYAHYCLQWGVILNGPGNPGNWFEQKDKSYQNVITAQKRTDLRRFSEDMQDGDIVVLKSGQMIGEAIGVIVGDYEWRPDFGDIDGWNLQHVRRVSWLYTEREEFGEKIFKWGATTQKVIYPRIIDWINSKVTDFSRVVALPELPKIGNFQTDFSQVSEFLFDAGLANEAINKLTKNMDELTRIADWYMRKDVSVSEPETIAYLVIPFLSQLGWTPQRMAVEWQKVDVALFGSLPRDGTNLQTIVEVKKRGRACLSALGQAERYANKFSCDKLVVTDGIRYGVFIRENGAFVPKSYLNILDLKSAYPILKARGAQDAILALAPD